jgi:hypothetical protein
MAATFRVVVGALAASAAAVVLAGPAAAATATPTLLSPAPDAGVQALPSFAWNGVAGAEKYEFAMAADAGFNSPVLGAGEGQFFTRNTRATVKKTLPNGTYWWRVRAIAAGGAVSPWTAPRPLRKAWNAAPTLLSPTNGAVAVHPTNPLVLKWAPVPGAARYWVTIASDPSLGSAVLAQSNVETRGTVYAPRAMLLPPGTYYWGVVPLDAQGNRGAPSAVASFTWIWPTAAATSVGDLRVDPEVYDPQFTWDAVPGAAKYELEVNPSQDFAPGSKVCCDGTLVANTYSPTVLLRDNTYYWRVRSLDAFGNAGEWNLGPTFTKTFDKVPPVTAPSIKNVRLRDNLSDPGSDVDPVTSGYQTHVPIVTWDPVPGASSYEVDVYPFETGMCNWTGTGWHSTTATNAWTMLGYGWNNIKPYPDARQVATEPVHPTEGGEYCVRVRARSDRAGTFGTSEVYGDYTYINAGTAPAFEWMGQPLGADCTPSCVTGNLGANDYVVPATGVTTTRMPLFTWKPMPLYPKLKLQNTSGATAVTLTGLLPGATDLEVTIVEGASPGDEELLVSDSLGPVTSYTYPDTSLATLVSAINTDPDRVFTAQLNVNSVALTRVTDANFLPGRQSYFVLVAKDPSFSNIVDYAFTQLPAYAPRGPNWIMTYPDETTLYYWAVLPASGVNGGGAVGNPLQAAPPNFRKESVPPTLTTPTGGADVVGQPTFRWSPAEGARKYKLQVSQDPSFGTTLDEVSTPSTAYTSNKSYPADTVLYWRVRADDELGTGLRWSAVGSFQRRLPVPSPRFDAVAGEMFPVMSWDPVPGAVSYRLAVDEPDGDHNEFEDFRSAAAAFVKMTGTGVTGIRVRANFPTNTTTVTPGPWSTTAYHTRTVGEPAGAKTDATTDHVLLSWDPKLGTKQYRVLISSREDFSAQVEDVKTDNTSYAPQLLLASYLTGGTYWWKVAAMDEDLNLGDFSRPQSFSVKGGSVVRTTQKLTLSAKGRLKARKLRRLVVTVKAGGRPISAVKVRAYGAGLVTKWRATNRKGQVVFRLKPKMKGMLFFQAMKTGYLAGTARMRVR